MCGDHRGEVRRVLLLHGSIRADLSVLDLVALMIDGGHFAEHLCVVEGPP
jgi:hypothetical protein